MQLKGIWGDITAEAANSRPTSEETRGKLNATRKPLNPSTANFGKEHAEFIDFFLFLFCFCFCFFVFDSLYYFCIFMFISYFMRRNCLLVPYPLGGNTTAKLVAKSWGMICKYNPYGNFGKRQSRLLILSFISSAILI